MILNKSYNMHASSLSKGDYFIDNDSIPEYLKVTRVIPHKNGFEVFYVDMISGKFSSQTYTSNDFVRANPSKNEIQEVIVDKFKRFSKFNLHHDKNNNTFIVLSKSQSQVDAMVKQWNANYRMKVTNLGLNPNDGSIRIVF